MRFGSVKMGLWVGGVGLGWGWAESRGFVSQGLGFRMLAQKIRCKHRPQPASTTILNSSAHMDAYFVEAPVLVVLNRHQKGNLSKKKH